MQRKAMDTIGSFPDAMTFKFIIVLTDTFTSYVELFQRHQRRMRYGDIYVGPAPHRDDNWSRDTIHEPDIDTSDHNIRDSPSSIHTVLKEENGIVWREQGGQPTHLQYPGKK